MRTRAVLLSIMGAALAAGCASMGSTTTTSGGDVVTTSRDAATLKENMRKLWTDHVVYTRNYIAAAVADDPSASAVAMRLMRNQEDIGNAIVPYYGAAAGTKLTGLLKDHINIAVDLVNAAKASDNAKVADADRRWKANAADIATFLSGANPNWPRQSLVDMLNEHLRLTTDEATLRIQKRWSDDVMNFDKIFEQSLHMADMLTDGIVKQFPSRF
jgi:hypothetical protein